MPALRGGGAAAVAAEGASARRALYVEYVIAGQDEDSTGRADACRVPGDLAVKIAGYCWDPNAPGKNGTRCVLVAVDAKHRHSLIVQYGQDAVVT